VVRILDGTLATAPAGTPAPSSGTVHCVASPCCGRSLRIAQVVPIYPPRRGGVGRVAEEYTIGLQRRGHSVTVFTPRHPVLSEVPDYVERLPSRVRMGNAAYVPSLVWRLEGFDIVHLHYPFFGGAEPVLIRKVVHRRQPLVVSYVMDALAGGARGLLFRAHQRLVLPHVLARADRVLVSSLDYARSSALQDPRHGLTHTEVHPYGVDPTRFHPGEAPAVRAACGVAPAAVMILFAAALDPAHHFKGLPVLLDALGGIREHRWHLVVVGDGSLRPRYEELVRHAGIADRVHFAGDVTDEQLPDYYRAADLHVLPSTQSVEAFGLVCLEAASTGIPTVVSALPGVRTVVIHQETGLHAAPGDPLSLRSVIRVLLERPELRTRLGHAARRRAAADFSWDACITRLEQTYLDLADDAHVDV